MNINCDTRTLADPGNKGKLDKDEFSVAMHLVSHYDCGFEGFSDKKARFSVNSMVTRFPLVFLRSWSLHHTEDFPTL